MHVRIDAQVLLFGVILVDSWFEEGHPMRGIYDRGEPISREMSGDFDGICSAIFCPGI